ncbi:MAG: hypothetical protein KKE44_19260 [Proteobacteria bacterium]|nr:hypothetical protein [Pseudomonadota bacterium]MBU1584873.1 hypothetical protein [Pseudomonadota bacterium]MBU2628753.1 hypothetical protein [Pseudomonadota bacterium]
MKTILITTILIIGLMAFSYPGFAEENVWEKDFVHALQKGKAKTTGQAEGLGYTPAEETVLENAIKQAMDLKAPPCEAMKIAVDLKYSPYSVIKNVFAHGGEVDLNQLCMCATESGINKQIVAKAAADATSSLGTPIFPRDEITQAQCLREIGLGYTPLATIPRIIPPPPPVPVSVASPAT